jgi:hypothetical protein
MDGAPELRAWMFAACLTLVMGCSTPSSGIRGDLRYVGGPAPGNSKHLEPGRVVVYDIGGGEAGSADFAEGYGFDLPLAPGTYVVIPSSGDAGCPHRTITIAADQYETVHFKCSVM